MVKWEVENEQQIVSYMVESGRDGFQFNERKTIKATNGHSYHWIDEQPEPGYHYYRLKIIEMNGKISYSRVVKIFIGTEIASVGIYPNPVVHGNIHLRLNHLAPGKYHARLINNAGQILHEHSFIYSGNYQTEIIHTGKNVTHGLYHLELINPVGVIKRLEIVY